MFGALFKYIVAKQPLLDEPDVAAHLAPLQKIVSRREVMRLKEGFCRGCSIRIKGNQAAYEGQQVIHRFSDNWFQSWCSIHSGSRCFASREYSTVLVVNGAPSVEPLQQPEFSGTFVAKTPDKTTFFAHLTQG